MDVDVCSCVLASNNISILRDLMREWPVRGDGCFDIELHPPEKEGNKDGSVELKARSGTVGRREVEMWTRVCVR